jgi:predicted nucleotidyltransferase
MTDKKRSILKDLKRILVENLGTKVIDVILFGSQLSENNHPDSDFDILIILKNKPDWRLERKISDICYDIELKYGILTDTHLLSESDFNTLRGKQPIFQNAISQGLYI